MKREKNQKNEECPLCKISPEVIEQLKRTKKETSFYKCPECGFWYKEKKWAEKCRAWCKKHKSCNLRITKRAIKGPS